LLVYSNTHLDVFNIKSADWIQSIGLKMTRPLSKDGNLSIMMMNETPYVVYFANMWSRGLLDTDAVERSMPRRRFSLRKSNRKTISAPTNFNRVSREYLQILE
jgi:serine/threonine-protein kinase MRCK